MTTNEICAIFQALFNNRVIFTLTITEINDWVSAGKDILVGLSAVTATFFAYSGLNAWKKELKGKAEYQLAKEVLKSVYRVREAFKIVRNPSIFQYEYPEEMTGPFGHLESEHNHEGTAHVYDVRWKEMAKASIELEEYHLEAQVEWGSEFQDVIIELRHCQRKLLITIQKMLSQMKNPHIQIYSASEEENDSILYSGGTSNEFTAQIENAINEFEKWLRPHIEHKS
jgi:hypothetical protein